jgi:hypothetical protein
MAIFGGKDQPLLSVPHLIENWQQPLPLSSVLV